MKNKKQNGGKKNGGKVLTYDDLMENDHQALVALSEEVKRK